MNRFCCIFFLFSLIKFIQAEDRAAFHEEFLHHVKYAMVVFKREPAIERILEFAAKFATSVDDDPPVCSAGEDDDSEASGKAVPEKLLNFLFNYIFKVSILLVCHRGPYSRKSSAWTKVKPGLSGFYFWPNIIFVHIST